MQCEGDERRDRTLDGSCAHRYYMYHIPVHITNQQRKSLVHVHVIRFLPSPSSEYFNTIKRLCRKLLYMYSRSTEILD